MKRNVFFITVCCIITLMLSVPVIPQIQTSSSEPASIKSMNTDTKVVYYDSRYPTGWTAGSESIAFKNYLVSNGFTEMNADQLKTFMLSNGVNSVAVITQDACPDTVADTMSSNAIIRQYLDNGGTVVWMEDIPLYYIGHSNGTTTVWGTDGMSTVLNVGQGSWDANDIVTITSDGVSRGLTHTWTSKRCASTTSVTKVLASSSGGAAAWQKNYLSIAPQSGFLRIWDEGGDFSSTGWLNDLLNVTLMTHVNGLKPIASFTAAPVIQDIGAPVIFNDKSKDYDGSIVSWLWYFGDGETATIQNPSHSYSQDCNYNVSLTVTDSDGLRSSTYRTIIVGSDQVDNSTMVGKYLFGYQGWFNCPGDGSSAGGWIHWFRNNTPDPGNLTVDYWPDISELTAEELYATSMSLPGGGPASVYSAYSEKTVMRHFQWMKDHHLDGVYLQRFSVGINDPSSVSRMNKVVQNVKAGAEANGRVWSIMWDVSGDNASYIVNKLKNDWISLVDNYKITESPSYLHHNGKPLLSIWGMGFKDRAFTPANFTELTTWFHQDAPAKYQASVMGGFPTGWRTLTDDSSTDAGWAAAYRSCDIISPWTVGRYNSNSSANSFKTNNVMPDLADCTANGRDYLPVIWPGFSWYNLQKHTSPSNAIPRNGGNFYWRQVYNVLSAGCKMIYGAMFDEVDEGTAMYKLAPTSAQLPVGATLVPLDIDGYSLPSDWYLRLADRAGMILRNESTLSLGMPIAPADMYVKHDARFSRLNVSQKMSPGQQYSASVTMKNNGNNTWTNTDGYKLGSENPGDNMIWNENRIYLSASDKIKSGQEKSFIFQVTAPSTPGNYNFQWKMVRDGVCWFGDKTINIIINVSDSNTNPISPSTPSGPASGSTGTTYTYTATATDSDSDQIKYGWDWDGDGTVDEWSSLGTSGVADIRGHMWKSAGQYFVKVKAQDEHGAESPWSGAFQVIITGSTVTETTGYAFSVAIISIAIIIVFPRFRKINKQ